MTYEEALREIIDVVDPLDPIDDSTVIATSDDLDSLALFNIMLYLKGKGFSGDFKEVASCVTLGDIVALIAPKS